MAITRGFIRAAAAAAGLAALLAGQTIGRERNRPLSYNPAFYSSGAAPGKPRLLVFPPAGKAFDIALPFAFGAFAFAADGKTLYAAPLQAYPQQMFHGLYTIEFNPVRETPVRDSESFVIVNVAVASRSKKIVITGSHRVAGGTEWGIFELDPSDGRVRPIVLHEAPQPGANGELWDKISVSPDGARAVAVRHEQLALIDLLNGTITPLGGDLEQGAWSPDGKWLAVNDRKKVRTVLLDAHTLTPARQLAWSHLRWSPDSRYLLGAAAHDACGPSFGTLQAIDTETGQTMSIPGSECKIDSVTTGWVSNEIR